MREDEFKYMLHLLDNLTPEIYEELAKIFFDIDKSKPNPCLSEEVFQFLRHNLKNNPVTTSEILRLYQSCADTKDLQKINDLYIDILKNEASENCPDKLITILSLIKCNNDLLPQYTNEVLKYIAGDVFKQHRKQILISLVPQERPQLIHTLTDFIHKNDSHKAFKLTAEYMIELCYDEKVHWLLKAAEIYKQQLHDMKTVTFQINNFTKQLLIMVLIDLTNCMETYDLLSLVNQLSNIFSILDTYTTTDQQLQFYLTEVKRELTLIKFCLENNCKIMTTSLFNQILAQSALTVISQVCRLFKMDRYKVSRLLNMNNDFILELKALSNKPDRRNKANMINWDISIYNSYCTIAKVIDTIFDSVEGSENLDEINNSMDDIRRLLSSIQPLQCCIEVIENIFSCLFLRYEYVSCYEHSRDYPCGTHSEFSYFYSKKQMQTPNKAMSSNSGFMCNTLITQVVLNTLKTCLENLSVKDEVKNCTEPNTLARFKRLVDVVNHSIWKMQLVSTLSPDTSPLQMKLCMDYVEVDNSSEDDEREIDMKIMRRKPKVRRRHTNPKPNGEKAMLASNISASDEVCSEKRNTIDFISIMLAKPNSLVTLALYHNDFPKANQILEMFDLSDSEIATEVTFTEQLRHLISKIKNIVCYRDCSRYPNKELSLSVVSTEVMGLVEGFLAANRAPNSFDIIELGSRHPHLQLYNHQNSPFINAVDILISSGLNREITYGLINVVERKLAEVRSSTDVASVKKINYIRFVEDIASVTFEIFGNADKSFDFTDNICELITDCRIPIKHKEFCKLNQLSKELRQCCIDLEEIVGSGESKIDEGLLQRYHQIYMNVVATSDKDICNIAEATGHGGKKNRVPYLRKCYMYTKSVSQLEQENLLHESPSPSESPYFAVLERHLHNIFGKMINNKDLPITFLEPICKKLNVNLIPKLILNFCPSISLVGTAKEASEENFNNLLHVVFDFKNTEEKLFVDPTADFAPLPRTPDPQCLTYVVLHNWVLAHIIKRIHTSLNEADMQQSIDARTKCLNRYMDLERFDRTKVMFNGNKYLASLHTIIDLDKLFLYLPKLMECGKILQCLKIIDSLSERQTLLSANLNNVRDLILFKLATNPKINRNWKYCQYLRCPELKVDLVLNNLNCWSAEGALEILDYLRFLLDQSCVDDDLFQRCTDWMAKIPLYEQIASIVGTNHWYAIYEKSIENPENIVEILMDSQQFKLCLDWADMHDVTEHMKNLIVVNLLRQLFEYSSQATPTGVRELLGRLSPSEALELILTEITKVRNVEILRVCLDFINVHSNCSKSMENLKVGLQIILEMEANLRHLFWDLIEKPILMIEQLLMNGKLDILTDILNMISPNLKQDTNGDYLYYNMKTIDSVVISRNAVDSLLRYYAEKALDMRRPRVCPSPPSKPWDDSLLQSIDSINLEGVSKPFVMPEQVPSKEQWVEDYTADRCMLCKISIFSMIIRRHHCRRCGRLVCHACSRSRMQVPTYPSGVKFRVCDDCYIQSMNKRSSTENDNMISSGNSDSAGSGVTCMDWSLSTNAKKNDAVRGEFSYEFTPNVTLCLSIMKLHTINLDYPRFLLDRSDEIARELAVGSGGDSRWLVRARRSLLLAAAELYSRVPTDKAGAQVAETGAAHVARCLSHAEAMATLVQHQAHHLVPHHGAHPSQIVRSLLEAEKWELALEIATKSGIPRSSVLAAWGKACLKAGCFREARKKFALCFKNTPNVYIDVSEEVEYGKEAAEVQFVNKRAHGLRTGERSISTTSTQSEGRVRSNPPLLNEIINMLEEMNYPVNQQLLDKAENMKITNDKLESMNTGKKRLPLTEPALNIMHMLSSVKKIKQGDFSDFQTGVVQPKITLNILRRNNNTERSDSHSKRLDPFFYKECVFYLSNYGSHVANIAFYMKHSNLAEVIRYCYENAVDRETFTDSVYMECLRRDRVSDMLKAMSDFDASLEMWSEYIMHICRTLEMNKRLDALYALQCGSGQHARASASCALLYSRPVVAPAPTFATLVARQHHLTAGLHHLGQCVPVANRINDPKSIQFHLDRNTIDNLMTTFSRQIELAKYLANCETANRLNEKILHDIIPLNTRRETETTDHRPLTLFGSNTDKIKLIAVVLAAGESVETGFELAFKIITEHKLDSMNIYSHVARYLVNTDRFMEVKTLAKCIRNSKETAANLMSDQVLEAGVVAVVRRCESRGQLFDEQAEILIADIHSVTVKISCYLTCHNVSSAYILAARNDRTNDLRRVLQEAERIGNDQVRIACLKRLTTKNKA